MGLFGSSTPQSFLGVDIGGSGVKLVELKNEGGRARLLTYAYIDRELKQMEQNPYDPAAGMGLVIIAMVKKAKAVSRRAVAAVPTNHVFSSILTVQATEDKAVREAVNVQARKLVPVPLEQMYLDSKVLEKKDKFTTVLITGATNTLVTQIMKVFEAAGIKLISLEPESFALIRALVGKDPAPVVIADIGALRTTIIIVERGVPVLSRSIATGGLVLTKSIAAASGVGWEQAERLKQDAQSPAPAAEIIPTIANEIRYLLQSFNANQGEAKKTVEKIVLTGGSARQFGLADGLGAALGIKTYIGDPWARVIYPTDLRPVLDAIGPRFSVAVGLAMRDIT